MSLEIIFPHLEPKRKNISKACNISYILFEEGKWKLKNILEKLDSWTNKSWVVLSQKKKRSGVDAYEMKQLQGIPKKMLIHQIDSKSLPKNAHNPFQL